MTTNLQPPNLESSGFGQSVTTDVTESLPESLPESFQWMQQWYPVAVIDTLDAKRPHRIEVLGKSLVIWRDQQQQWHCFDDACPHRLVPLSEGRVEADGTLLCAYHAWRFGPGGKCVGMPQAKDGATESAHCDSPKACAIAYPTQQRQGLLWVWPQSGKTGFEASQGRSPNLIPELEQPSERVVKLFWNHRDLPYGWDYFMENVADPGHVVVSHHGLMGSRYSASYYDMPKVRELSTHEGFAFGVQSQSSASTASIHDFQPPCLMKISTTWEDGGQLILVLYATPTRPGWCRHIGCQVLIKNEAGKTPPGLGFFAWPMPAWVGHILASLFLHQDLVFLHYQERLLGPGGGDRWLQQTYTPNPQDKMVVTLRQWLKYRAGGGVAWDGNCDPTLPPPEYDKDKLFDVWSTHTKNCQPCRRALRRLDQVTVLVFGLAIACFGAGIWVDGRAIALQVAHGSDPSFWTTPPLAFWGLMVGAGGWAIAAILLRQFRRLFYVYRFEHADND
ncbi:MAG: Rieske 2Fe-2S domain-containing protein [Leptolyngbyaceae bacterium]|nr:Rieske 2Fe-2S domain-containing protein [Leptolyngbyaceae bacterium]